MSGETIEVWGTTPKVLESAGTGFASGSLVPASNTYDKIVDGGGYPDGQFILAATFNTAPVENSLISLYVREYAMDGSGVRTDAPETTRPGRQIGSFQVNDRTASQPMILTVNDLPAKADYYLHNNGTGQAVAAGWKLTVVPRSYKSA